ncbi:2-oxoacid:acceptor oxidoreductase family protein [Promethearchaeum syntrophicum]|uniref:2-oxoacid:acceptor oxidoreductase family protein n=1 Tax=Promethearchaeum syntrophicum TaxID=2594042 RepID=A0A5B9DE38_9ARCH|nr:2-oxoacid:acceptor oxidoreductase family protein [Candidatus Prometheoarchaeum syntrophicum]QEE17060.1 2-oxoglutarate synthase subunit KorC [Candidatus Prometheoarchaeum syntrophicum]
MVRTELKFAGYGGQGVITLALLAAKAALEEDKEVSQSQAYTAVARGGSVWAETVISDEEINYPRAMDPDFLILLSVDASKNHKKDLKKKNGVFITDPTSLKKFKTKKTHYQIPAAQIAIEQFKMPVISNVILFGSIVEITGIVSRESARNTIASTVPPKTLEMNLKALDEGFRYAEQLKLEIKKEQAVNVTA